MRSETSDWVWKELVVHRRTVCGSFCCLILRNHQRIRKPAVALDANAKGWVPSGNERYFPALPRRVADSCCFGCVFDLHRFPKSQAPLPCQKHSVSNLLVQQNMDGICRHGMFIWVDCLTNIWSVSHGVDLSVLYQGAFL